MSTGEKSCAEKLVSFILGWEKRSGLRCWPEMRMTKQSRLLQISGDIMWATATGSSILDGPVVLTLDPKMLCNGYNMLLYCMTECQKSADFDQECAAC
jgi:hypothetical protein